MATYAHGTRSKSPEGTSERGKLTRYIAIPGPRVANRPLQGVQVSPPGPGLVIGDMVSVLSPSRLLRLFFAEFVARFVDLGGLRLGCSHGADALAWYRLGCSIHAGR